MTEICKVIYINLNHRHDRNAQILSELKKMFPQDKIYRQEAFYTKNHGGLGCLLSHCAALKYAIQGNFENVLIVEDDFQFTVSKDAFDEKIKNILGTSDMSMNIFSDFNVCLLASNIKHSEKMNDNISRLYDAQTTSCYLIKKPFYNILLQNFQDAYNKLNANIRSYNVNAADQSWKKLMREHIFIGFTPALGKQRRSFSDISRRVEDYNV